MLKRGDQALSLLGQFLGHESEIRRLPVDAEKSSASCESIASDWVASFLARLVLSPKSSGRTRDSKRLHLQRLNVTQQ